MKYHELKVIEEQKELRTRAIKLSDFIGYNPAFNDIEPKEQELMKEQCEIMWEYFEVLEKRISNFKKSK